MTKFQEKVLNAVGRTNKYILDYDNMFIFHVESTNRNVVCRIVTSKLSYYEVRIELSADNGYLGATLYQCSCGWKDYEFIDWCRLELV